MTDGFETILVDRSDGVVTVTLNRPERKNAATLEMWQELGYVLSEVNQSRDDRVLVLTGAGGSFCSGADIGDPAGVAGKPAEHRLVRMQCFGEVMLALHRLNRPTIAKVRGLAMGAGMSVALQCDLVVAASDAKFSEIFTKRGLSPDGGSSWLLPRMIGLHKAKELAFFADVLSAQEASELGVVNRVVEESELDDFVADWARRLADAPPIAIASTKRLLNNSIGLSMAQAVDDEARCQTINFLSEDFQEAMAAFSERREPKFAGR